MHKYDVMKVCTVLDMIEEWYGYKYISLDYKRLTGNHFQQIGEEIEAGVEDWKIVEDLARKYNWERKTR